MARNQRRAQPVSDDEYSEMPARISEHFDRIHALLERERNKDGN